MDWMTLAEVRSRHASATLELESLRVAYQERLARDGDSKDVHDAFQQVMEGAVKRVTSWSKIVQYATRLKSEEETNGH